MGMFDFIKFDNDGNAVYNQWVEWNHFLIPNKPIAVRDFVRKLMFSLGHCKPCTALDGCYFIEENMPPLPIHPNCDCDKINIRHEKLYHNSSATCSIEKITKYIFGNIENSKGKRHIFESLGYSQHSAELLKSELEKQAQENYCNGNYILKSLDQYGQRLAIPINLSGKTFYSGWLLYPEGKLKNTTPFGGWAT